MALDETIIEFLSPINVAKNISIPDHEADYDGWLWDELWTSDVDKATSFYQSVVGFQHTDHEIDDTDHDYRVLKMNDTPRAGVLPNPFEGERPVWVNYLRVKDPSAVITNFHFFFFSSL